MSTAGQAELGRLILSHYFWFRYLYPFTGNSARSTRFLMCLRGQRRPALSGIRTRPFDFSSGGASTANLEVTGRRVYDRAPSPPLGVLVFYGLDLDLRSTPRSTPN